MLVDTEGGVVRHCQRNVLCSSFSLPFAISVGEGWVACDQPSCLIIHIIPVIPHPPTTTLSGIHTAGNTQLGGFQEGFFSCL